MKPETANRIAELAMKWSNSDVWHLAFLAAESWLDEEQVASQNWDDFETMSSGGQQAEHPEPEEVLAFLKREARDHQDLADAQREIVDISHNELNEMANLIRENAPKLLELVPSVNFNCDPADIDLSQILIGLRKIEGSARFSLRESIASNTEKPPRDYTPTEADMLLGRKVYSDMSARNPSVESFREKAREMGFHASNRTLGMVLKAIKAESKK